MYKSRVVTLTEDLTSSDSIELTGVDPFRLATSGALAFVADGTRYVQGTDFEIAVARDGTATVTWDGATIADGSTVEFVLPYVDTIIAGGSTGGGGGDASAANQVTGNNSLSAIDSKLGDIKGYTDGLEALATTLNGYVDGLETLIGSSNTLATSLNGYVDGLEAATAQIGTRAYGTPQRVAIGTSEADTTGLACTEVLLHATAACFVISGATPAATVAGGIPLAAGEKFHMRITNGHQISVIGEVATGYLYAVPVA